MVRICRVSDTGKAAADDEFRLPVFAFVFTKFRKLPNAKLVRFVSFFSRLECSLNMSDVIKSLCENKSAIFKTNGISHPAV